MRTVAGLPAGVSSNFVIFQAIERLLLGSLSRTRLARDWGYAEPSFPE